MKPAARSNLVYGVDQEIAEWVSLNLSGGQRHWFEGAKAIGVIQNDRIIAGIVYSDIRVDAKDDPHHCSMSIYSVDKRWATRHNLQELFRFPFTQLGLRRVHTVCSAKNGEVMNFNKRLGFVLEGVHPDAWPLGGDSVSFGMLAGECRWI